MKPAIFVLFSLVQVLFNSFPDDSEAKVTPTGLPKKRGFCSYGKTRTTSKYCQRIHHRPGGGAVSGVQPPLY